MKKLIFKYLSRGILFLFFILIVPTSFAREGMWLPQLLSALNEKDMKSMGMEISAEDIYSIKKSSLKDAVLQFGGGCTGELISNSGLLVTNHHCGFSQIQSLSTIQKNYLENGFWANDFKDEIPCPGLTVTFIRDITEVTEAILAGVSDTTNEELRVAIIKANSDSIEKSIPKNFKGFVRPFYNGNKYYLFTTEVFSDIRFVGAPPQSIGKFGGETDNWMWPRHTGDFALFRIYSGKNNESAKYSADNIPYTPKKFLTINIGGVKDKDFVFVFGFPGRTNRYIMSSGLETIATQTNPNRIAIREIRLDEMRNAMRANDTISLQYASKFSTIENSYKKWKGELLGFSRFSPIDLKRKEELKDKSTAELIRKSDSLTKITKPLNFANDFYVEAFPAIELLASTSRFNRFIDVFEDSTKTDKEREEEKVKAKTDFRNFYKNYNAALDRRICQRILTFAYQQVDYLSLPVPVREEGKKTEGDFKAFTDNLYKNSLVADSSRLMSYIDKFTSADIESLMQDPACHLSFMIDDVQKVVQSQLTELNGQINRIQRSYVAKLMEKNPGMFPDANSTLRVSYGRVEGMMPNDGVQYRYYTTAEGILQKSQMDVYDYKITPKLAELIKNKDYGRYGKNGELPVGFLASAHTTGGNSGSPVLNANGELVGLNFDRMWEGVLSDYYYDETYCRNICLDIRYALFVIEKYGNAERLIKEMKIVEK